MVEDDENDAFFMLRAMKKAGITNPVQQLSDGREALNYFQGDGKFADRSRYPLPSLVLLDLKLPHVMGLDVLKWVRSQDGFQATTFVVLSASQDRSDVAQAYRHGAAAYLVKPPSLDQLDAVAVTIRDSWLDQQQPPAPLPE